MEKRKLAKEPKAGKRQTKKERKALKDPNLPKRPPSAFFVFMEDFRKTYKEKHPDVKSVSVVGKAGGDKWKAMSDQEKAPFVSKAAERKADYVKCMAAYKSKGSGAKDTEKPVSEQLNGYGDSDEDDSEEDD